MRAALSSFLAMLTLADASRACGESLLQPTKHDETSRARVAAAALFFMVWNPRKNRYRAGAGASLEAQAIHQVVKRGAAHSQQICRLDDVAVDSAKRGENRLAL